MIKLEDLPPLEDPCNNCEGTGRNYVKPDGKKEMKYIKCVGCNGTGFVLSLFGQKIIDLVTKYTPSNTQVSDMIDQELSKYELKRIKWYE